MDLSRDYNGVWSILPAEANHPGGEASHPAFIEALPRYMTALDPAFSLARARDELQFLFCLFRVRGEQDAGWDPYETTLRAIPALLEVYPSIADAEAARHLQLWIYGHIVEASEPYELVANLIGAAKGESFMVARFPPKPSGAPVSPGTKIRKMEEMATSIGRPGIAAPLREVWDRVLRNAVFHADYAFHGAELRTLNPARVYGRGELMTLVNRAIAYHAALSGLYRHHIESYEEPKEIVPSPHIDPDPELKMQVIVREGYGAAGVKDMWTEDQVKAGKVRLRLGRFYGDEGKLMDKNPSLAVLPRLPGVSAAPL